MGIVSPPTASRQPGTVMGYYGSKTRAAQRIIDLLPPHDAYVEPFCGSLAVLMAKPPAGRFADALEVLGSVAKDSPERHQAVDDLERARRVWVKLAQGRGGQLRPTGWRYHERPHGRSSSMPGTLRGYVGRFAAVAERLQNVSLECRDAYELIEKYGRDEHTLLYVDPPYLGSTRARTAYRHEMNKADEHAELAGALSGCKAAVVVSGYRSELYDDLYAGWHVAELAAFTGQANSGREEGERIEVLWSNRPLGGDVLDFGEASA